MAHSAQRAAGVSTPKILIACRYLPLPNTAGSATHMFDFVAQLSRCGFKVEFVLLDPAQLGPGNWFLVPTPLRRLVRLSVRGYRQIGPFLFVPGFAGLILRQWLRRSWHAGKGILPARWRTAIQARRSRPVFPGVDTTPASFDALPSPVERATVQAQVARFQPNVIIADYSWLAGIFDDLPPGYPAVKVVFVHDLAWRGLANRKSAGIQGTFSEWSRAGEAALLQKAEVLLALQAEDAALLRDMAPKARIIRISVSVTPQAMPASEQVRGRCLYVGSDAEENAVALRWFLREVWPAVLQVRPEANLHVCGTVSHRINTAFSGVRLLGRVEDLTGEYGAAEVCIVPHIIQGGIKLKLVEAMAHGRAAVASPCGVDGLPEAAGQSALVAESPAAFAAAVIRLLNEPSERRRMESAAIRLSQSHLSPEAAYGPFVDYLRLTLSSHRIS